MENKRRYPRLLTKLKGQYFLEGKSGILNECTVTNICPRGMRIEFYETMNVGSIITIMTTIPSEPRPIRTKGTVKWLRQRENGFVGGVEFKETLDDETFAKFI